MTDERITAAIDRIERALARIDAAAKAAPRDPTLPARHQALRQQVSASLAEIDGLIKAIDA